MAFKQIGVTALRGPKGEFLPAQPIYIEVKDEEINPITNMLPQEEKTFIDITKLFAEKIKQYVKESEALKC